jgi:glycosyltransferase involved in cell wall biosynthesis
MSRSGKPRRIVLCVQNLSVPQDPRVWREARDLAAAGYSVHVICPRVHGGRARESLQGVEIHRYRAPRARAGLVGQIFETVAALMWTTLTLARLRLRGRIEVLHAANPPDTYFLVAALARPFGVRFVFDQHDAVPELLGAQMGAGRHRLRLALMRLLERSSYARADLVVSPNESYRELALCRGNKRPDQVVVVRSGPDEIGPERPRVRTTPPTVAFAGAMNDQDGVQNVIDAAAEILGRRPGGVRLELFGTGDAVPALQRRVDKLGISESVQFVGWVERAELLERLRSSSVAVSPDDDNSFTRISTMLKVIDYLGVGLPCVIADLPENRATAGDAVAYFRAGDPASLAKQIEVLLDDAELADELAARARDRARALLWEHSRGPLLNAYRTLVGEP